MNEAEKKLILKLKLNRKQLFPWLFQLQMVRVSIASNKMQMACLLPYINKKIKSNAQSRTNIKNIFGNLHALCKNKTVNVQWLHLFHINFPECH